MARIICLANSYKRGGRCIAGMEPKTGRWIRPVPDNEEKIVTPAMRLLNGAEPQILDVIEIPVADSGPDDGCQPENRRLKPGKWKKLGRIPPCDLLVYCQDDAVILHNPDDRVPPGFFSVIPRNQWRSLQLIHNTNVQFMLDHWKKWRAHFQDGMGTPLALKVTDPVILEKLQNDKKIGSDCILTTSLTTPWKPPDSDQPKQCYKLVAGVVEL